MEKIFMDKKLSKAAKKAAIEAKLWAYAAWTLPFIALAALVFEHFIGWTNAWNITIIVITVVFFSISVFWWWWALNKFTVVLGAMRDTEESFSEIKDELKLTRKEIQKAVKQDVGDR
jgi:hypothetical protein